MNVKMCYRWFWCIYLSASSFTLICRLPASSGDTLSAVVICSLLLFFIGSVLLPVVVRLSQRALLLFCDALLIP